MTDTPSKTLDPEIEVALADLFDLAGQPVPDNITGDAIKQAVNTLKTRLASIPKPKKALASKREKNVLVVGFMGIINLQLKQILSRVGASVEVATSFTEAMETYQNSDIDIAIIDISSPNEKAGLKIIEEIKRLSVVCNIQTQILVLGQPSKSTSLEEMTKSLGAGTYIEKGDNWQELVLEYYLQ